MKILITAGPTREKIDDVRYISNYSSGKMGYAIAENAQKIGFDVYLVSGPVNLNPPNNINLYQVESADEMYNVVITLYKEMDVLIFSAAVADFKPKIKLNGKFKKEENKDEWVIELTKNKDILASVGKIKNEKQIVVGFALESENEIENAKQKLIKKNCDMIILNSANKVLSGFSGDYNTITIIDKLMNITEYPPMLKTKCAEIILDKINNFNKIGKKNEK